MQVTSNKSIINVILQDTLFVMWSGYVFIDKQDRTMHTCSFTAQIATNNLTKAGFFLNSKKYIDLPSESEPCWPHIR